MSSTASHQVGDSPQNSVTETNFVYVISHLMYDDSMQSPFT